MASVLRYAPSQSLCCTRAHQALICYSSPYFLFRPTAVSLAAGVNGVTCRPSRPVTAGTQYSRRRALHRRIVTKAKQNEEQGSLQLPGACICCCASLTVLTPWQILTCHAAAILKIANGVTNSAAALIPATVPRPVAKLSVVGVCGILALWLFGKVIQLSIPRHAC